MMIWIWSVSSLGFAICFVALLLLKSTPSLPLLYLMVIAQGFLGYGVTAIIGAVAMEIFEGKHFGSIYGTLSVAGLTGGAAGPWITGVIHDYTDSYAAAFWIGLGICALSILSIWMASPRKGRAVAGQMQRIKA